MKPFNLLSTMMTRLLQRYYYLIKTESENGDKWTLDALH